MTDYTLQSSNPNLNSAYQKNPVSIPFMGWDYTFT